MYQVQIKLQRPTQFASFLTRNNVGSKYEKESLRNNFLKSIEFYDFIDWDQGSMVPLSVLENWLFLEGFCYVKLEA